METASKYPAVKILITVVCGIILGYLFSITWDVALLISVFSIILIFLSFKLKSDRIAFNIAYIIACLSIGLWISSQVNWKSNIHPNLIIQDFPAIIKGKVVKILQEEDSYYKCVVEGQIDSKHLPVIYNTKAILTISHPEKENLIVENGNSIIASGIAKFPDKAALPTDFNEVQYCISNDADWIIRANSKDVSVDSEPTFFDKIISGSTKYIKEKIRENHSEVSTGIIIALITGDKSEIPQETKRAFSLSGTAHVLAVSGLHVGIFSAIVFLLLGFMRNKWIKLILFSIIIFLFIVFTGYQPSAQRAGLMAIVALFVHTSERRTELFNLLCWIVILLIILFPQLILKPGFQMSVASIAGIALLYKPVNEKLSLFIKSDKTLILYIKRSIAISISASVAVSPIVAYYFNVFSIISPITNIIVIPTITLAMIFALIGLVFLPIIHFLASIYASASDIFVTIAKETSNFGASVPLFYISDIVAFQVSILISIYIVYLISSNNKRLIAFRAVIGAIIVASCLILFYPEEEKKIEVIPRRQLTALIIPSQTKGTFVLLADRKPSQNPYQDYGLQQYLLSLKTPLTIGYTGNSSIAIIDKIKKIKKIKYYHIPLEIQDKVAKLINTKEKLPKIIHFE